MKKVADFIVEKRYIVILFFIIITGVCLFLTTKVNINYDITKYLPKDSETRVGMDIMEEEFGEAETSTLYVMFENVSGKEKKLLKELESVKGVSSVDYDKSETYNKDNYTLYILNVDDTAKSKTAKEVYETVKKDFSDYKIGLSGTINEENQPVLHMWIVFTAIGFAMLILIIMCDSYVEPFLFLFTIGLAVFINKGTNIMFDSVSHITDSICAVLQMALSMDYSIMLMNRYTQEKAKTRDRKEAMKRALQNAFGSISSSSVTTIVGMMALVFMSFTIGKDLGFVLAKGVLLSLICIFCVLPGLILIFDKYIEKTKKKHLTLKLDKLGRASYTLRYGALGLFIILFVGSFILKGNLNILYTASENDEVAGIFKENNQMAIIYNNKNEDKIANICRNIDNTKVNQVLCYGNTINEKLSYSDLKTRISDLGSDIDIDDYLLRIVYYNYYAGNIDNAIALSNLIDFLENNVYQNNNMNEHVDANTRSNIDRLKYFAYQDQITKERVTTELADILGVDKDSLEKLLILYHSNATTTSLNITEFVDFVYSDVLNNETFSSYIDDDKRSSLNTLRNFIDKNDLYNAYDSTTMANIFGIDKESMDSLYLYYYSINGVDTTLTMHEFSEFILNDVVTDPTYSSMFDSETIKKINLLNKFSDTNITNSNLSVEELSELFGIDKEKVLAILLLKDTDNLSDENSTVDTFIEYIKDIKENTNYLDNVDLSAFEDVIAIYEKLTEDMDVELGKDSLKVVFQNLDSELVNNVYEILGLDENTILTSTEFCDLVLNELQPYLSDETYNNINTLKNMLIEKVNCTLYPTGELSVLLNLDEDTMTSINSAIEKVKGQFMSTPKDFVEFLINNLDNSLIADNLDDEMKNQLLQVSYIINNSENKMDYSTMASSIGLDISTTRSLYALYSRNSLLLNKVTLVNFILEHEEDPMLSSIDSATFAKLKILKAVIDGVENDSTYNASELSNLLRLDNESIKLLYSYYEIKNGYNQNISLINLVEFILKDVLNNQKFNTSFDNDSINKLNNIDTIMNDSLNNRAYTSSLAYNKLSGLSNNLDSNLIDLIYLYYASVNDYDNSYKLTVEEFVNYLNNDILKDNRFTDFIDDDIRENIVSSKDTIDDAKKLLIGNNYSRVVINTDFEPEDEETFTFIKSLKNDLSKSSDTYLIGDSPMAFDLDKTFGSEFNFISILTMLLIFMVVAITFKSPIIPLILTLVIQCAVYMTMGILSIFGGSVYFIALLIVQSILMGATIDYAILFTSYYLEYRQKFNKKGALINAYNQSIHTILTSASVLIIVTFIVGFFASAIAAKICMTISQGTLCSTILVLFLLPAVLAALDKFIVKKKN